MDDFGKFCYLDVQKTGSTFITALLNKASLLPLLRSDRHAPIQTYDWRCLTKSIKQRNLPSALQRGGFYRKNVIYFNSIRHPFKYYASLYNYGCDKRGGVYLRLRKSGLDDLYDGTEKGFLDWVNFILQPENRNFINQEYNDNCREFVGFLTYRFLRLSFVDPKQELPKINTTNDLNRFYDKKNICVHTIRNENLRDDLISLIDLHLAPFVDKNLAVDFLDGGRINASDAKVADAKMLINTDAGALIKEREAFIFDRFYAREQGDCEY